MGETERGELDAFEAEKRRQWDAAGLPPQGASYYDRTTEPMSFADWVEAFEDLEYRRIGEDITNGWRISTVWLGLDHGVGGEPEIFETMVFDERPVAKARVAKQREEFFARKVDPDEVLGPEAYQNRYSTEAAAIEGHRQAVAAAEAGLIRR